MVPNTISLSNYILDQPSKKPVFEYHLKLPQTSFTIQLLVVQIDSNP
jgi:hypothetical protein